MKTLIMCEGSNELEIIRILLQNHLICYKTDDLLGKTAYHARQISKSPQVLLALRSCSEEVEVLRIGDTMTDRLAIPVEYKARIIKVVKYCTKPELEMLLILAEGMLADYERAQKRPKLFAKERIKLGRKKYDNSTMFYHEYFYNNPERLVWAIREYKRIKRHNHGEEFLASLLR